MSEKILNIALRRYKMCVDYEYDRRQKALDDLKFRAGEQWDPQVLNARKIASRPALVVNKMPQFVRNISNEMRQNKPAIKVYPVDSGADIDTARVLQGMIRNIEYSSNADSAYIGAGEGAVEKSFGFFRVISKYVSDNSFDQELAIEEIANHFSVYIDCDSVKIDGSDAEYGFVIDTLSRDTFERLYPKAEACKMTDWSAIGADDWFEKDSCRIAEYFYKEYKTTKIYKVKDPLGNITVLDEEELSAFGEKIRYQVLDERETEYCTVKWCKIVGNEVLEETDWLGSYIPIIPVYGARVNLNGKFELESLIRHSKDSQRILNYYKSNEAESISLAPKSPWIVAEGQIPPEYSNIWENANKDTHSFLPYKPTSVGGVLVPAPQRNVYEPAIVAISNAVMMANEDIKATTGIYDASLGNRSNESSGVAIARRNAQAQTSNYHFIDNLGKSIQHCGRILVELIPIIYSGERMARIIGEDGAQDLIKLNQDFIERGKKKRYQLNAGKYDVVVEIGPSYETKRQEAAASMIEFTKTMPQFAGVVIDLIAKNMDWPDSQTFAERLKKTLPAGIADDKNKPEIPPAVQMQIQQMSQMIEQLTKQLNESSEAIKTKRAEIESKERIEFAKLEQNAAVEAAKLGHAEAMQMLLHDQELMRSRLENSLDFNEDFDDEFKEPVGGDSDVGENNQQGMDNEQS